MSGTLPTSAPGIHFGRSDLRGSFIASLMVISASMGRDQPRSRAVDCDAPCAHDAETKPSTTEPGTAQLLLCVMQCRAQLACVGLLPDLASLVAHRKAQYGGPAKGIPSAA